MKKQNLILVFVLIMILSVSASSRYIIFFNDVNEVSNRMNDDMSNRGQVIRDLKQNSEQTLDSFNYRTGAMHNLEVIRHFWSINAVAVKGDERDVYLLENYPEVDFIVKDVVENIEQPVNIGRPMVEDASDEFTYGLTNLNVPQVWEEFGHKGEDVLVGIIDTGIQYNHPEFKDKDKIVGYWKSGSIQSEWKDAKDSNGHGSHVAGTIAGGNESGKHIGVAPEAKLIIAQGIDGWSSDLLGAMEYMLNPDGNPDSDFFPRVVNCSWHSGSGNQDAYYRMFERWIQLGIFPAFSAGNSGPSSSSITKPKEHPDSFASGAIDNSNTIARFSSRGPGIYNGEEVNKPELSSPGVDVYSVRASGGYTTMSGTSMASPHTAGVVALALSANPDLGVTDLREILINATHDAGDPGYDYAYGHGTLDAYMAVRLAKEAAFVEGNVSTFGENIAAEIKVKETGRVSYADENGDFRLLVFPGKNTLVFNKFGYTPVEKEVNVSANQTVQLDVTMNEAPKISISGQVKEEGITGNGIKARIDIVEIDEFEPVETDSNGYFDLEVIAGSYSLVVNAFGYESKKLETQNYTSSTNLNVELAQLPPVVFIDKDSKDSYAEYYFEALDELGVDYYYHNVSKDGPVEGKHIYPFYTVIWSTADVSSNTFTNSDVEILSSYLDDGGSLFATGQDLGYNMKSKDFYADYLKAEFIEDNADSRTITGQDFEFDIEGGSGANNQKWADAIASTDESEVIFDYKGTNQNAAVYYSGDYNTVYFGFGFEAIDTKDNRVDVLSYVFDLLEAPLENKILRLQKLENMEFASEEEKAKVIGYYTDMLAEDIYRNYSAEDLEQVQRSIEINNPVLLEAILNLQR
ncbi:MAG: S8 family serine peptidase [Candidatus Muiribacteriota bacterium]